VGLERGPLSLVSTTEELLERKSSGSVLETRKYGRGEQSHWSRDILYPQKLAVTSPTSGSRSVGIVRLWATKFVYLLYSSLNIIKTTESSRMGWAKIFKAYGRQKMHTWKRQNKSDHWKHLYIDGRIILISIVKK
jgi:hypothetical protein